MLTTTLAIWGSGTASAQAPPLQFPYSYGIPAPPSGVGAQGPVGLTVPISSVGATGTAGAVGPIGPPTGQYGNGGTMQAPAATLTLTVYNGTAASHTASADQSVTLVNATTGDSQAATTSASGAATFSTTAGYYLLTITASSPASYVNYTGVIYVSAPATALTRYLLPSTDSTITVGNGPSSALQSVYVTIATPVSNWYGYPRATQIAVNLLNQSSGDALLGTGSTLANGTVVFAHVDNAFDYQVTIIGYNNSFDNVYYGYQNSTQSLGSPGGHLYAWLFTIYGVSSTTGTVTGTAIGAPWNLGADTSVAGGTTYLYGPFGGSTESYTLTLSGGTTVWFDGYDSNPHVCPGSITIQNETIINIATGATLLACSNAAVVKITDSTIFGSFIDDASVRVGEIGFISPYGWVNDSYLVGETNAQWPGSTSHVTLSIDNSDITRFGYRFEQDIRGVLGMWQPGPACSCTFSNVSALEVGAEFAHDTFSSGAFRFYQNDTNLSYDSFVNDTIQFYSYGDGTAGSSYGDTIWETTSVNTTWLDGPVNSPYINPARGTYGLVAKRSTFTISEPSGLNYDTQLFGPGSPPLFSTKYSVGVLGDYYGDAFGVGGTGGTNLSFDVIQYALPNMAQELGGLPGASLYQDYINANISDAQLVQWLHPETDASAPSQGFIDTPELPITNGTTVRSCDVVGEFDFMPQNNTLIASDAFSWNNWAPVSIDNNGIWVGNNNTISNDTFGTYLQNRSQFVRTGIINADGSINAIGLMTPGSDGVVGMTGAGYSSYSRYSLYHDTFDTIVTGQNATSEIGPYISTVDWCLFDNRLPSGPTSTWADPQSFDLALAASSKSSSTVEHDWFLNLSNQTAAFDIASTSATLGDLHYYYSTLGTGGSDVPAMSNYINSARTQLVYGVVAGSYPTAPLAQLVSNTSRSIVWTNSSAGQMVNGPIWVVSPDVTASASEASVAYQNGLVAGPQPNFFWHGYNYSESVEPLYAEIGVNSTKAPSLTVAFGGLSVGEPYALSEYNSTSGGLINGPANQYVYPTLHGWINVTYNPATMPTDPTEFVLSAANSIGAVAGGAGSFVLLLAAAGGVILLGTAFGAYLMATNRREDGP